MTVVALVSIGLIYCSCHACRAMFSCRDDRRPTDRIILRRSRGVRREIYVRGNLAAVDLFIEDCDGVFERHRNGKKKLMCGVIHGRFKVEFMIVEGQGHIKSLDIGKSPEWRARLFRAGWSDPRATLRSHNMPTTVRSPHFGIQHLERFGDGLWKTCYRVQNSVSYARGRTYLRKEGWQVLLTY